MKDTDDEGKNRLSAKRSKPVRIETKKNKEKELYEPIRRALFERFEGKGDCTVEITANNVSDKMKRILPKEAVYMMGQERIRPDLIGVLSNIGEILRRTFIVEVKAEWLDLKSLFQAKLYAEMLQADWAFLISPKGFRIEHEHFLKSNFHMLGYSCCNGHITSMKILENGEIEFIESLKGADPFGWL
jgi:hypothetical protein